MLHGAAVRREPYPPRHTQAQASKHRCGKSRTVRLNPIYIVFMVFELRTQGPLEVLCNTLFPWAIGNQYIGKVSRHISGLSHPESKTWCWSSTQLMLHILLGLTRVVYIVVRDNLHQHALTDWIMLDLSSILHADFKTVFVFALGPFKTIKLTFCPIIKFWSVIIFYMFTSLKLHFNQQ